MVFPFALAALTLQLATAAPIEVPLVEGATWTYTLRRYPPSTARFLLFFAAPTGKSEVLETWTWRIGPRLPAGQGGAPRVHEATLTRKAKGFTPAEQSMRVWRDADGLIVDAGEGPQWAFSGVAPEGATASDRVRCNVPFLGGRAAPQSGPPPTAGNALCAARPGGPAATVAGLQRATLSGPGGGAFLGKVAIGLLTGGAIIPGDDNGRIVLQLKSYRCENCPAPERKWPLYAAWKKRTPTSARARVKHLKKCMTRHPVDAESLAAILADVPTPAHVAGLAEVAVLALPPAERLAVARVALERAPMLERLRTLARLGPMERTPNADTLLTQLSPDARASGGRLLAAPVPVLRAVLAAPTWEKDKMKALRAAVKKHSMSEDEAVDVFAAFRFGGDKAIPVIHQGVAADAHGRVFARQVAAERFGNKRLALLGAHPEWVAQMSPVEKSAVLEAFRFKKNKAAARELLGI